MSTPPSLELEVEYARFNSEKTVGDGRPSAFSAARVGPLTVTCDPARADRYYHRVLGLSAHSVPWLDEALQRYARPDRHRVDVDASEVAAVAPDLRARGLEPCEAITWLGRRTGSELPAQSVRRLRRGEVDRVLPLLELDGAVDAELWATRRVHYATERYRIFVVDMGGVAAAMATTFVGAHGAVLGNAVTHPDHRRRGHQTALIAARLVDAAELGLPWVHTDVEPHTSSHRNCLRAGFSAVQQLEVWERGDPS